MTWLEWCILIALVAILLWLLFRGKKTGGSVPASPPPPYPNPTTYQPTAVGLGMVIPQGRWSGPSRQLHGTVGTYTFTRETYNYAATANPLSPSPGISIRLRVRATDGEKVEIQSATKGQAVGGGSDWWAAVTDVNGVIEVVIQVAIPGADHQDPQEMIITAEELDSNGSVTNGAEYPVEINRH